MKTVIGIVWMGCVLSQAFAQPIIDTTAVGESANYKVENTAAYYEWQIDGGQIVRGSGDNAITVEWGNQEGAYMLTVVGVNSSGCYGNPQKVLVLVKAKSDLTFVHLPTAFSPNGDGANDEFAPIVSDNYISYSLTIFSRWGNLAFAATTPSTTWDGTMEGKIAPDGVYVMLVVATFPNGKRIQKQETLTIAR